MPFLKRQNTNTSIDRSSTNQNRVKGTNQKAPFHKQLANRNTEWLSNQTWCDRCVVPVGLILCVLMCCPCGAHTLYFNVLSLWGSYSVL
jgi:hypothetical protein